MRDGWRPADPPERLILFVNPKSGDGTAVRAALADRARERWIEATVLGADQRLATLVGEAVAGAADALGRPAATDRSRPAAAAPDGRPLES